MSGVINGTPATTFLTAPRQQLRSPAGPATTDLRQRRRNDTINGGAGKDEIEDKGGGNDLIIVGNNTTAGVEDKVILEGGNDQVVIQNTQGYAVVTTGVGNDKSGGTARVTRATSTWRR